MAGTPEERDRAHAVASKLGTYIAGERTLWFWHLEILEKLVERIDDLAQRQDAQCARIADLEGRMGDE